MMRLAILLLVVFASTAQAGDRVRWLTRHHFVPAYEPLDYDLFVPRHPENRRLVVTAVAEDGHVSESRIQLDGEQSRAAHSIRMRLPAGEIVLVAVVYDATKEVGRAMHSIQVQEAFPR